MGWWGYGIYDGDGPLDCYLELLERSKMGEGPKSSRTIELNDFSKKECWEMTPKDQVSHKELVKLYENYDKCLKALISPSFLKEDADFKKLLKKDFAEDNLIAFIVLSDFFILNKSEMPKGLKNIAIRSTELLLESSHTKSFSSPQSRKRNLKNFLEKLNQFQPEFKYKSGKIEKVKNALNIKL